MVEDVISSEFYCCDYATKDQPHIEGLLQSLVDGVRGCDREIAERELNGEPVGPLERGKKLLHRLISSTNRRMHKGYPEMLSYLLHKPLSYCSHSFVTLMFDKALRQAEYMVCAYAAGKIPEVYPASDEVFRRRSYYPNTLEDHLSL